MEDQTRVAMNLDLNKSPFAFEKKLSASDIGHLSRLLLDTADVKIHILNYLSAYNRRIIEEGSEVKIKVYDDDTETEYDLVLKRMIKSSGSYILKGGWVKEFVKRRDLKIGYKLGVFWNGFDYKLHLSVLSSPLTNLKNPK